LAVVLVDTIRMLRFVYGRTATALFLVLVLSLGVPCQTDEDYVPGLMQSSATLPSK
jgi:hypothetical protein